MRKLLLGFAGGGLCSFCGAGLSWACSGRIRRVCPARPLLARSAPMVQLDPLEGHVPFAESDLTGGGVKLVNFWASWCAPCRAEHPKLVELSEKGIPVYGVNYKDNPAKARAFLAELGNPYTLAGADPRCEDGAGLGGLRPAGDLCFGSRRDRYSCE